MKRIIKVIMNIVYVITGLFLLLFVCAIFNPSSDRDTRDNDKKDADTAMSAADKQKLAAFMQEAADAGLVKKVEARLNNIYVDPLVWAATNVDQKKQFTAIMAQYCESIGDTKRVTVYDYNSGRKIAKYDSWGFKVY